MRFAATLLRQDAEILEGPGRGGQSASRLRYPLCAPIAL
jgi:hypothetical protein